MRERVLIKRFDADESERSRWDLGTLRLVPPRQGVDSQSYITIPSEPSGLYLLTPNLSAETWTAQPRAVKQWTGFQAEIRHVRIDNEQVTSARFKLGDESSWYWWNGAAWVVHASNWNTEAEISEHIDTFPVSARSIRVRVNLATTDARVAPRLTSIKLSYRAVFDHIDDYIYRSLIRDINANLRIIGRMDTTMSAASSSFTIRLGEPYRITGGLRAFDLTADPNELVDLFDTWTPGATQQQGTFTTISQVPAGHMVRFYFEHAATIAHTTSADFYEVNAAPCINILQVEENDLGYGTDDHVINVHNQQGVKVLGPRIADITFNVEIITSKEWDMLQVSSELKRYFSTAQELTSLAMDEKFSLWVHEPFKSHGTRGIRDVYRGTMSVTIRMAVLFERGHRDAFGVQTFIVTGDANFEV